jgi:hypothetical protein
MRLELGGFGEVEVVDFPGEDDHFEGFFGGGARGGDIDSTFCSSSTRDWF